MALYTIMRIYEVPADNRIEATDRMLEALEQGVERDYHVKDIIRAPQDAQGIGTRVSLDPPRGWLSILREQLLGVRGKHTKR